MTDKIIEVLMRKSDRPYCYSIKIVARSGKMIETSFQSNEIILSARLPRTQNPSLTLHVYETFGPVYSTMF